MIRTLILTTLLFSSTATLALPPDTTPVPGGIAIIKLPADIDPASTRYRDRKVLITNKDGENTAVIGLSLILFQGRDRAQPMPFGPYLAVAGWIALYWGNDVLRLLSLTP